MREDGDEQSYPGDQSVHFQLPDAQRIRTGEQVTGIPNAQHNSRYGKKPVLSCCSAMATPDHHDAYGNDYGEIQEIKCDLKQFPHAMYWVWSSASSSFAKEIISVSDSLRSNSSAALI